MYNKELQQAKRELFGLFGFLLTIGVFAATIAAFIWMFWVGVKAML